MKSIFPNFVLKLNKSYLSVRWRKWSNASTVWRESSASSEWQWAVGANDLETGWARRFSAFVRNATAASALRSVNARSPCSVPPSWAPLCWFDKPLRQSKQSNNSILAQKGRMRYLLLLSYKERDGKQSMAGSCRCSRFEQLEASHFFEETRKIIPSI